MFETYILPNFLKIKTQHILNVIKTKGSSYIFAKEKIHLQNKKDPFKGEKVFFRISK